MPCDPSVRLAYLLAEIEAHNPDLSPAEVRGQAWREMGYTGPLDVQGRPVVSAA